MIKIIVDNKEYQVDQFTFSGGEVQIKVPEDMPRVGVFDIHVKILNAKDIMALILTMSVLKPDTHSFGDTVEYLHNLHIHYFPYARQDREMVPGEAISMQVMAQMINIIGFNSVHVWDIHNEDTLKYIMNYKHKPQEDFTVQLLGNYAAVVSPDKGALPKVQRLLDTWYRSNHYSAKDLLVGNKVRDPANGKITHTEVDFSYSTGSIEGKDILIVDDICDGGRTFIELAKVLRTYSPKSIDLYVTHGIFSAGLSVFDGLIDNIYTTDSFFDSVEQWHLALSGPPLYIYEDGNFINAITNIIKKV